MITEVAFLGRQETECTHRDRKINKEKISELLKLKINQQND